VRVTDAPRLHVVIERSTVEAEAVAGTVGTLADSAQEAVSQPAYGVRADERGPRGCWALKRDGTPCAAPSRRDADYCAAHSGLGVAKSPADWAAIGTKASAESRRRRATLRLALGRAGVSTPRGVLRAAVFAEAERVAAAALAGLEAENLTARSKAALALLDAVDPPVSAELSVDLPSDPSGVSSMGLEQLRALAERVGIDPSPAALPSPASP